MEKQSFHGTTFWQNLKTLMKPQQQNSDLAGKSHVYVQKPDGEQINIPAGDPAETSGKKDEGQTAENMPATHSKEVSSGEDG